MVPVLVDALAVELPWIALTVVPVVIVEMQGVRYERDALGVYQVIYSLTPRRRVWLVKSVHDAMRL
jgi:hypothetical protein